MRKEQPDKTKVFTESIRNKNDKMTPLQQPWKLEAKIISRLKLGSINCVWGKLKDFLVTWRRSLASPSPSPWRLLKGALHQEGGVNAQKGNLGAREVEGVVQESRVHVFHWGKSIEWKLKTRKWRCKCITWTSLSYVKTISWKSKALIPLWGRGNWRWRLMVVITGPGECTWVTSMGLKLNLKNQRRWR